MEMAHWWCRPAMRRVSALVLSVALLGLSGCTSADQAADDGLPAMLSLLSPVSPLGLNYGESAVLELGYTLHGKPRAGVTLRLSTDGDDGGTTLSSASVVTNDRGQASVLLTAGAAESAFHVLVTVAQADELVIDVAVSRYAFGSLAVRLDAVTVAPSAVAIEAGLYTDQGCSELAPMLKLLGALRSAQNGSPYAELRFTKLLLRDYTVLARALDWRGRPVATGCVGMPERLLRSAVTVPLAVPLHPLFLSPVGSFTIKSELQLHLPSPPFATLACRYGLGQVLLDALVAAVPPADRALAMRLQAARALLDGKGCRAAGMPAEAPDQSVQTLLGGTSAGANLITVATDMSAVQDTAVLTSRLDIRGSEATRWFADHTLQTLTLKSPMMSAIYALSDVPNPMVRELPLGVHENLLSVPPHALSLQLPQRWRRALNELVLEPRGVAMNPMQLWQAAIASARSGMATGCPAIEAVLCSKLASPCKGLLSGPCMTATSNVAMTLQHALDDASARLDLSYGLAADLDDPDDLLRAKALTSGQASGEIELGSGTAAFTAIVTGSRRAD